jgi:hypothetical protein
LQAAASQCRCRSTGAGQHTVHAWPPTVAEKLQHKTSNSMCHRLKESRYCMLLHENASAGQLGLVSTECMHDPPAPSRSPRP